MTKDKFDELVEEFENGKHYDDSWVIAVDELSGLCTTLVAAIRKHRDYKGDDRCWMDDEELYKCLPEGYVAPERGTMVELQLCQKFINNRFNPNLTYISPQRRIEELEKENKELKEKIQLIECTNYSGLWGGGLKEG